MNPSNPNEPTPTTDPVVENPATPETPAAPTETTTPSSFGTPAADTVASTGAPLPGGPKSKKGLIIGLIAGGAVLLAGLVILLVLLFGNKNADTDSTATTGDTSEEATNEEVSDTKDVIDRPDGTLDLSDTVEGNSEVANQTVTAELNQQVNLKDGGTFMVTKVERNFTGFNETYFPVEDGEEVVAVTIVAGSRSTAGTGINKAGLKLSAPSDDAISSSFASSLAKVDGLLDSANNLKQGEQVSGKLLWIVKSGETPLALTYTVNYTSYTTDESAKIFATINL